MLRSTFVGFAVVGVTLGCFATAGLGFGIILVADPLFPAQWHLHNVGQGLCEAHNDIDAPAAWALGYTGRGVHIAILDDGLEHSHPDIEPVFDPLTSYDFVAYDPDPSPEFPWEGHGTAVAGLASSAADGFSCGVGVAHGASLSGVRILGVASLSSEAAALRYMRDVNWIYSCSWGPPDWGTYLGHMPDTTRMAIEEGVQEGRGGLGSIIVFAAGNGYMTLDNVNYDAYASNRFTIAVAASDCSGKRASFSELGACILVNAPGVFVTTTARKDDGSCRSDFSGTSASAPIVAGVVALMLETNPALTWLDVQEILVESATKNDPENPSWRSNGVGRPFSHEFGFGRVNAAHAVSLALQTNAGATELSVDSLQEQPDVEIPVRPNRILHEVFVESNLVLTSVELELAVEACYRGDIALALVSPSGTLSVLQQAHNDWGFDIRWTYVTVACWGEPAAGTWQVVLTDVGQHGEVRAVLRGVQLHLHGTCPSHDCPEAATFVLSSELIRWSEQLALGSSWQTCTGDYPPNPAFELPSLGAKLAPCVFALVVWNIALGLALVLV